VGAGFRGPARTVGAGDMSPPGRPKGEFRARSARAGK
jgi:hypothetical protein